MSAVAEGLRLGRPATAEHVPIAGRNPELLPVHVDEFCGPIDAIRTVGTDNDGDLVGVFAGAARPRLRDELPSYF